MFTGLVEEQGTIDAIEERPAGRRFWIACARALEGTRVGDSVAVSGCCLTAIAIEPGRFGVEAVPETLSRTGLGGWRRGTRVNLERSLRLDQRLGGHLMQGHVDGTGTIRAVKDEGDGRRIAIEAPQALARFIAGKGSIAVDGVSLTVAEVRGSTFEIAYIPHTLNVTTAGAYASGDVVNLEVDVIARYIARMLDATAEGGGGS